MLRDATALAYIVLQVWHPGISPRRRFRLLARNTILNPAMKAEEVAA
jgi:hypothetical protein